MSNKHFTENQLQKIACIAQVADLKPKTLRRVLHEADKEHKQFEFTQDLPIGSVISLDYPRLDELEDEVYRLTLSLMLDTREESDLKQLLPLARQLLSEFQKRWSESQEQTFNVNFDKMPTVIFLKDIMAFCIDQERLYFNTLDRKLSAWARTGSISSYTIAKELDCVTLPVFTATPTFCSERLTVRITIAFTESNKNYIKLYYVPKDNMIYDSQMNSPDLNFIKDLRVQ